MIRGILYCVFVAVLIFVAISIANLPGRVDVVWLGTEISAQVGILLLAFLFVGAALTLFLLILFGLVTLPGRIGRGIVTGRRERGYRAFSQGMVAIAAGDGEEARLYARKADKTLDEPPLTALLSAQAAQLNGDEQAAQHYFEEMLKREDTRFLGLRGLLMQAMRQGDRARALALAKEAYALRPKSAWVLQTLFELAEESGDLATAQKLVGEAKAQRAMSAAEAGRRRGVILLEQALIARAEGRAEDALKLARKALKSEASLVPATQLAAELLLEFGRNREARKLIERYWGSAPHPALVGLYRQSVGEMDALRWLRQVERMTAESAGHTESRLARAAAAIEAEEWAEARQLLAPLTHDQPEERVCRLMAELEERQHGESGTSRRWRTMTSGAPPAAGWVCESCGAVADGWSAHCGNCGVFDQLAWRAPKRTTMVSVLQPEASAAAS